jgi:hypothetical protein
LRREAAAMLVTLFFVSPEEIEEIESLALAIHETLPQ